MKGRAVNEQKEKDSTGKREQEERKGESHWQLIPQGEAQCPEVAAKVRLSGQTKSTGQDI